MRPTHLCCVMATGSTVCSFFSQKRVGLQLTASPASLGNVLLFETTISFYMWSKVNATVFRCPLFAITCNAYTTTNLTLTVIVSKVVNKPDGADVSPPSSLDLWLHFAHLVALVSWFLHLDSLHWSLFFSVSTCSRLQDISFMKLSSTRRVISNMAALKTVSMTPESCD